MTEAHGDLDAATVAEQYHALAIESLVGSAQLVKTIGDAVMIVAFSIDDAVATAVHLARAVDAQPSFPVLRAGLHAGTAVERNGDYYGAAVNLAARVASHAGGGQVLCTRAVAIDGNRDGSFAVTPLGTATFKNVMHPVEIFVIDQLASEPHIDPVCRTAVRPGPNTPSVEREGRTIYFCSEACANSFSTAR